MKNRAMGKFQGRTPAAMPTVIARDDNGRDRLSEAGDSPRQAGEKKQRDGNAVDAIHEVEGVDEADSPDRDHCHGRDSQGSRQPRAEHKGNGASIPMPACRMSRCRTGRLRTSSANPIAPIRTERVNADEKLVINPARDEPGADSKDKGPLHRRAVSGVNGWSDRWGHQGATARWHGG